MCSKLLLNANPLQSVQVKHAVPKMIKTKAGYLEGSQRNNPAQS